MSDVPARLRELAESMDTTAPGDCCHDPELLREAAGEIERLLAALRAVKEDDLYVDGWCPVCHEHPGDDDQYHGGTDCVMKTIGEPPE